MGYVRFHSRSGAPTRLWPKRGHCSQGLGRSVGGLSIQIQAVCDALGNSMHFLLTAGNRADYTQALTFIKGARAQAIIADRGYDADYILQVIHTTGTLTDHPTKIKSLYPAFL